MYTPYFSCRMSVKWAQHARVRGLDFVVHDIVCTCDIPHVLPSSILIRYGDEDSESDEPKLWSGQYKHRYSDSMEVE